ncbi:MAG: glutamate-cysteine ligase family protein [Cyclobacteriaceae bacterium]
MGSANVRLVTNQKDLNHFTRHLLKDVHAMEHMLEQGWFDDTTMHIGAEQEICLVDQHHKPAPKSMQLLKTLQDKGFTTELAQFNIEANLDPLEFHTDCFSKLEKQINDRLDDLAEAAKKEKVDFVLTGILPTIRQFDLEEENLTPLKRYDALIKAINKLRGKMYEVRIVGMDELHMKYDSAMIESCNTSFQVHLQVTPDEFVDKYNISQVITAPVLSLATNSPMLFGKRLWSETRVALFQQSVDTRVTSEHIRDRSPRVTFGNSWLKNSIVDMYKEDVTRFRVMLMADSDEEAMDLISQGVTPKLSSLMIHNSTVYRWNRPCYGVSPNGKPHLRIENRVLPSGPSTIDEVANAAFWIGMMNAFGDHYPDLTSQFEFDHAKGNFVAAARNGMETAFKWAKGKKVGASELIKEELIPIAREGLEKAKIHKKDIDRYLDVIAARNETSQTGTRWIVDSQINLMKEGTREEATIALTAAMARNQKTKKPIHEWELATLESMDEWSPHSMLVEEFMTTDVFTVHEDDIPELVADIMDWRSLKHLPVEDVKGRLTGLISYKNLLGYFSKKTKVKNDEDFSIEQIMIKDPLVISPEATVIDALRLMKRNKVDCLPVVINKKLVGVITEANFLNITATILNNIAKRDSVTSS